MIVLSHGILGLLPIGGGELLRASLQRLLHKHLVTPCLKHIDYLLDPPPYCVGCGKK